MIGDEKQNNKKLVLICSKSINSLNWRRYLWEQVKMQLTHPLWECQNPLWIVTASDDDENIDCVDRDFNIIRSIECHWEQVNMWNKLIKNARTHSGLQCLWWWGICEGLSVLSEILTLLDQLSVAENRSRWNKLIEKAWTYSIVVLMKMY